MQGASLFCYGVLVAELPYVMLSNLILSLPTSFGVKCRVYPALHRCEGKFRLLRSFQIVQIPHNLSMYQYILIVFFLTNGLLLKDLSLVVSSVHVLLLCP